MNFKFTSIVTGAIALALVASPITASFAQQLLSPKVASPPTVAQVAESDDYSDDPTIIPSPTETSSPSVTSPLEQSPSVTPPASETRPTRRRQRYAPTPSDERSTVAPITPETSSTSSDVYQPEVTPSSDQRYNSDQQYTPTPDAGSSVLRESISREQKSQIRSIKRSAMSQIQSILTAEQRAQVDAARQRGEKPRDIMSSLNLSSDQQSRIREIRRSARQDMQNLLTPEQLQDAQAGRRAR
jgi:hypothetical protein